MEQKEAQQQNKVTERRDGEGGCTNKELKKSTNKELSIPCFYTPKHRVRVETELASTEKALLGNRKFCVCDQTAVAHPRERYRWHFTNKLQPPSF